MNKIIHRIDSIYVATDNALYPKYDIRTVHVTPPKIALGK